MKLSIISNNEYIVWHRLDTLIDLFSQIDSEQYPDWSDLLYSKAVELQGLYEYLILNDIMPPFGELPADLTEQMEVPTIK